MPLISWILAELVRFCGGGDPAAATALVKELSRKRYPYFEEIEGRPYINRHGQPREIALLILYGLYPRRIRRSDLVDAVVKHGAGRSAAVGAVHRLKSLVDDDGGQWLLRGLGRQEAEDLLRRAPRE